MNPLQRTLIEKAGHDNGFEHVLPSTETVTLASARHRTRAEVSLSPSNEFDTRFQSASPALLSELRRSFGDGIKNAASFHAATLADLSQLLRRAARLSQALPNQAERDYQTAVQQALAQLPPGSQGTEIERMARQRIGQDRYRAAMLDYWSGVCAVTGVAIPEVLRASHAKPWAECESDAERLDAFNGFLLVANLDTLFDRFPISFDGVWHLLISDCLSPNDRQGLEIHPEMKLRWLTREHQHYLQWHREHFLLGV
ncbi:MAG: HNH endonuclease [Burkholderiaceae bacterium]|jgi:predicted restriction endonuclease|nr:HNH endonuclease [Burkholderiaceae bacterium]